MTCFKCNTPKHVWFQQQQMLQAQRNEEQLMMQQQYQMQQQQYQMQQQQMMQQHMMQQVQMQQATMRQQQMRQQHVRQQRVRQQQAGQQQAGHPVQPGVVQAGSQKVAPEPMCKEAFEKARLLIKRRREQHAEQELRQKHEASEDMSPLVRVKREGEGAPSAEATGVAELHPTPPALHTGVANGTHEVEVAGMRTREERDRELLAAAIDVDGNGNRGLPRKRAIPEAEALLKGDIIEPELSLEGDDDDILASIGCGD
jgi:hypothetical protein